MKSFETFVLAGFNLQFLKDLNFKTKTDFYKICRNLKQNSFRFLIYGYWFIKCIPINFMVAKKPFS